MYIQNWSDEGTQLLESYTYQDLALITLAVKYVKFV